MPHLLRSRLIAQMSVQPKGVSGACVRLCAVGWGEESQKQQLSKLTSIVGIVEGIRKEATVERSYDPSSEEFLLVVIPGVKLKCHAL